jgi:hypothetical protein
MKHRVFVSGIVRPLGSKVKSRLNLNHRVFRDGIFPEDPPVSLIHSMGLPILQTFQPEAIVRTYGLMCSYGVSGGNDYFARYLKYL